MSGTFAEGERVSLRHPSARDREEFLERVRRAGSSTAAGCPPVGRRGVRRLPASGEECRRRALLVCRNEDGAIAGVFNIGQIFYGPFCGAYLGYYAFAPFAGRGYMRDGIRLVLRLRVRPAGAAPHGGEHPARQRRPRSPWCGTRDSGWRASRPDTSRSRDGGGITSAGRSSPRSSAPRGGAGPRTKNPPGYRLPTAAHRTPGDLLCRREEGARWIETQTADTTDPSRWDDGSPLGSFPSASPRRISSPRGRCGSCWSPVIRTTALGPGRLVLALDRRRARRVLRLAAVALARERDGPELQERPIARAGPTTTSTPTGRARSASRASFMIDPQQHADNLFQVARRVGAL